MSDEINLEFIGKSLQRLLSDVADMKEAQAKHAATIENMDATLTRMQADVVDAKATGKEVAVRLTLVEHRLTKIDTRIERIEKHLGLVTA